LDYPFIAGLILSAAAAWAIGANDMANSVSVAVGSGTLKYRTAVLVFTVSMCLGSLLQGYMVMKTLGRGIVASIDLFGAVAAVSAAFTWIMLATVKGLPVSTTHSITGGVLGVALAYRLMYNTPVNTSLVFTIVLSWITSPLAAMALSMLMYVAFRNMLKSTNSRLASALIVAFTAFSAYCFGANDVANSTGVYVSLVSKTFGVPDEVTMRFLALYASLFMAVGGIVAGRRVVETLAYRITRIDALMGVAAGFANAFTVWIFTTVPYIVFGYGLPISTTYAAAGAIMGVGIARSRSIKSVNLKMVLFVVSAWVLTVPTTSALSFAVYYLLHSVFG